MTSNKNWIPAIFIKNISFHSATTLALTICFIRTFKNSSLPTSNRTSRAHNYTKHISNIETVCRYYTKESYLKLAYKPIIPSVINFFHPSILGYCDSYTLALETSNHSEQSLYHLN